MSDKTGNCKIWILFVISCIGSLTCIAQLSPEVLQKTLPSVKSPVEADIIKFYALRNYQTAWIEAKDTSRRNSTLNLFDKAAAFGLRPADYNNEFIVALRNNNFQLLTTEDSMMADIRMTDAAIHFFRELAYGNEKPSFGYYGLTYTPDRYDIAQLVSQYHSNNILQQLPFGLSTSLAEIYVIQNKLDSFIRIWNDTAFREVKIISNKVNSTNQPLITKLRQLDILSDTITIVHDTVLVNGVKEAQKQFGLLTDGALRTTTLQQLNLPLRTRIKQLSTALNYYRWFSCFTQELPMITVNIPAAYMKVYKQNTVILEMRMVVGKRATPTPTLTSKVSEVVLYPYWHVPVAIATKELLPKFRRSVASLDEGNYQILDRSGKIMDPQQINWQSLSRNNFPYIIRQSTGCDNALGLLKLNFYNPFDVYLHDTNGKHIFMLSKRFYSHGCMRMEKPMDLGRLVLDKNRIAIDTLVQKGCLRNQSPISVPARVQMPVIVWYNPAGIDPTGRILFFEDVYDRFAWMKN